MNIMLTCWTFPTCVLCLASSLMVSAAAARGGPTVCLLVPYVTTILNVEVTFDKRAADLSLQFQTNYNRSFAIDNITIFDNGTIDSSETQIIPVDQNDSQITYTHDKLPVTGRHVYRSKGAYRTALEKFFGDFGLREGRLIAEVAQRCSPIYIHQADFYFQDPKSQEVFHVIYYKDTRCLGRVDQDTGEPREPYRRIVFTGLPDPSIISASYKAPFLIELNSRGEIVITRFPSKKDEPRAAFPFGTNARIVFIGPLAPLPETTSRRIPAPFRREPLLKGKNCTKIIGKVQTEPTTDQDLYFLFWPLRTIIDLGNRKFRLYFEAKRDNQEYYEYQSDFLLHSGTLEKSDLSLEAVTQFTKDNIPVTVSLWLNPNPTNVETIYLYYGTGPDNTKILHQSQAPGILAPDDITYWQACDQLVLVYGFAYTMITPPGQINETVRWHTFDVKLFSHPIEAIHSEGDNFWFWTKKYQVLAMKADSSDCSTLNLTPEETMTSRDFFGHNLNQSITEEMIYEGDQWSQGWMNSRKKVETSRILNKNPVFWIYIGAGSMMFAIVLVTIIVIILKFFGKASGDVIYSRSKTQESGIRLTLSKALATCSKEDIHGARSRVSHVSIKDLIIGNKRVDKKRKSKTKARHK